MYVFIGKEKCNQCNILKNLLDEKGIQYHYVDVSKIPPELLTYLRMYCNTYPIVLGVNFFSTFNEMLEHFKDIWICFFLYLIIKQKTTHELHSRTPLTNSTHEIPLTKSHIYIYQALAAAAKLVVWVKETYYMSKRDLYIPGLSCSREVGRC
jgi:hypothetical protein